MTGYTLYIVYNAKLAFLTSIEVVAWPVERKFSRCRKVQESCNEHRDPFKNCELGVVYYVQRCDEYEAVALRVSKFTIPSTDPP